MAVVPVQATLHAASASTTLVSYPSAPLSPAHALIWVNRNDDGQPQISGAFAMSHMQALEDIGYRTVGTEEAVAGEEYVLDQVRQIAARCKHLQCEVDVQKGSGYHS